MATVKCPKCGSTNANALGTSNKKGYNVGKAATGAVLTGGLSLLVGFGKNKKKYEVFCADCGHRYRVK